MPSRENFNLDNSFVILLKDRVTSMEQLTIVMIRWFIINSPLSIISIITAIVGTVMRLDFALILLVIFAVNMYIYIRGIQFIYQPEKERLHDIVYNDFYKTHKVNSEILLQDIQSADYRMGQISIIISTIKATAIFNIIASILSIALLVILK